MTLLTGFLPVAQGVAAYAALSRQADAMRRRRATTEGSRADHGGHPRRPVHGSGRRGRHSGRDPARDDRPRSARRAATSRRGCAEPRARSRPGWPGAWSERRTRPGCAVSSSHRPPASWSPCPRGAGSFQGKLRDFLVLRDEVCRTPWCDAPVRHVDHPQPHARGGSTTSGQRAGTLRELQLRQGGTRLVRRRLRVPPSPPGRRARRCTVTRPPPAPRGRARPVVVEFYRQPHMRTSLPAA